MSEVDAQEDWDTNISSQETTGIESSREEDVETIDQGKDCEGDHGNPSPDWLHHRVVGDQLLRETLHLVCLAETNVDNTTADPGDEARGVGKIDEPTEDDRATARTVEIREWGEESSGNDGHVGNTTLRASCEDFWSITSHS